jgi:cytochrome c oxidase subunit 3
MSTAGTSHASKIMPGAWPVDAHFGRMTAGKMAMWFFLLADAMSFAGLLLGYGILRAGSERWIGPLEPELGIGFTAALTFLLICSSVTMVLAYAAIVEKKRDEAVRYLALTVIGGALFLVGQMHEYFGVLGALIGGHGLIAEGLVLGQSMYANTFYVITAFHGLHVLSGVIYLSVMLRRVAQGKYDDGDYNHIEMAGLFWHFVDLVWILVFTLVYLIP